VKFDSHLTWMFLMLQAEKRKQEEIRNEEVATRENHRIGKSLQNLIDDIDSNLFLFLKLWKAFRVVKSSTPWLQQPQSTCKVSNKALTCHSSSPSLLTITQS
jgi:hypothetical protein